MSNFYFCNDCKIPTDLVKKEIKPIYFGNPDIIKVCLHCGGTNVEAVIDRHNA